MSIKDRLCVGQIVKPQGIKGEVKAMALTDDPHQVAALHSVLLEDEEREILSARVEKSMVVLRLRGVNDRNQAESLRRKKLYIYRAQAEPLPEGHHYIVDLIGCMVSDDSGRRLGVLREILQNSARDVYIVKGDEGTLLFPALKDLILSINIEAKEILLSAKRLEEVAVYEN